MTAARIGVCLFGLALSAILLSFKPDALDDFQPFYRAGRLVGSADVFAQSSYHAQSKMFLRTPVYAALLWPLARLAYPTARRIWLGLMVVAFALAGWLWPGPRRSIVTAMCWSVPVLLALALGQDIALLMLVTALSARLWMSGREFAAGLVASLLALKITLLFPVALVFLVRSRRGCAGLAIGIAAHCGLSFAIQGPGWFAQYLAAVRSPLLDQVSTRMPSVRALVGGAPFIACAAAIYIWLLWFARRVTPALALTAALPLGIIAAPHCYIYDLAAAIPLFATTASARNSAGILALAALSPAVHLLFADARLGAAGAAIIVAAVLASTSALAFRARFRCLVKSVEPTRVLESFTSCGTR